ncbi:hypothetical protein F5Y19DRAFT_319189 [Xylariaceae sp. FL1651]|nr:hypothetical protein F5Y19DRAFT_319189 [Xylariaceae sp. FL1651]
MASVDDQPSVIPKRIIICCDGTWQSAVSGEENSPSNVTRLARSLQRIATDDDGKKWQQIVWYDSGVGTTSGWLGKKYEGALGAGLESNVIEAYNFVSLNWSPGDQVLCFGFSRGAYTARTIAGLISDIGICEPRQLQYFPEIWKLIKEDKSGERFYGSDNYFKYIDGVADAEKQPDDLGYRKMNFIWEQHPHGDWARTAESREIEVVGVYDTVGALGMPSILGFEVSLPFGPDKKGFHNVQLNRNIKRAFHALALDDHREAFTPTLWSLPDAKKPTPEDIAKQQQAVADAQQAWYPVAYDKKTPKTTRDKLKVAHNKARRELIRMEEAVKDQSKLTQVWFPGVHINIGGGSSDTLKAEGDLEEMSNITFAWMLDQIKHHVGIDQVTFSQETRARQNHIDDLNKELRKYKELMEKQEKERAAESYWAWTRRSASSAFSSAKNLVMHPFTEVKYPNTLRRDYGWGTGTIIDSYTLMYKANGSKPRTPGGYARDAKHTTIGDTNEFIHPTVGFRIKMTENAKDEKLRYRPAGQEPKDQFVRRKVHGGKGYEYIIAGAAKPLPEWPLAEPDYSKGGCFERLVIAGNDATKFVEDLDKELGYAARPY